VSGKEQLESHPDARPVGRVEAVAWIALLCVRGVLLWLVVPLAFCFWLLLLTPVRAILRRKYLSVGQVIGWFDLNLIAAIAQILIRPFGRQVPFTPWLAMSSVEHRVSLIDPA
jgi:hypothetical protein